VKTERKGLVLPFTLRVVLSGAIARPLLSVNWLVLEPTEPFPRPMHVIVIRAI